MTPFELMYGIKMKQRENLQLEETQFLYKRYSIFLGGSCIIYVYMYMYTTIVVPALTFPFYGGGDLNNDYL